MDNTKNTYKTKFPQAGNTVPPSGGGGGLGFHANTDYDEALERSVLGVLVMEPQAFGNVYGILTADCFYKPHHHHIFAAMHTLWQQGHPIDMHTLVRHLYDTGIHTIGTDSTAYYIGRLTADVVSGAHLQQWCGLLRHLSARRTLITLTGSGLCNDDVYDTVTRVQQQLEQAMAIRTPNDWIDAATAAKRLGEHMEAATTNAINGISTTFRTIDQLNGGLRPGQLVVIGARPSAGKSALMGNIATAAAKQGHSIGIISLEMAAPELMGRMLSSASTISFTAIDRNRFADEEMRMQVHRQLATLATLPIWFCDTTRVNIHDIRARAEKLKNQHHLDLLIVDYLQLVEEASNTQQRNREQNISAISRGLKMLAMNLQIPVIALSQLNRESESRANKRPTMADLRESGAIEQDADIIMLLHRDWRCGITTDATGNSTEHQADLFIAKWRNGTTCDIKLHFDPITMTFTER